MKCVPDENKISNIDDIVELTMDTAIEPLATNFFGETVGTLLGGTANSVPQVAVARFVLSAAAYAKNQFTLKKFSKFFKTLNTNDFDWEKFNGLSEKNKQMIRFKIITTIDKQTSELQTEALAYLTNAFLMGQVDNEIFASVANELERINPSVFAFESDWAQYKINDTQTKLQGSTAYLPTSFCSSNSPNFAFSSDQFLTPSGRAFFKYVYFPMYNKNKDVLHIS